MGKLQGNATQSPSCWQPRSAPSVQRGRWGSQPGPLCPAGHGLCQECPSAWAEYLAPSVGMWVPAHPPRHLLPGMEDRPSQSPRTGLWAPQRGLGGHREGGASRRASSWTGPECGPTAGQGWGRPSRVFRRQAPWGPRTPSGGRCPLDLGPLCPGGPEDRLPLGTAGRLAGVTDMAMVPRGRRAGSPLIARVLSACWRAWRESCMSTLGSSWTFQGLPRSLSPEWSRQPFVTGRWPGWAASPPWGSSRASQKLVGLP